MKKVLATLVCAPIHSGHINILKTAKSYGYVIAGLVTDEGNEQKCNLNGSTPLLPFKERYAVLSSIKYVDEVIPYQTEEDLEDILNMYNISIRFSL